MTASQLPLDQPIGSPGPEIEAPGPAIDEPGPTVDEPEDKKRRRRRAFILLFLLGLLALLIGLMIWYLLFRQPLPLPVIPESGLPGYSTSMYGSDSPTGIAVTPSGDRLYVTDTGGDKITRVFDAGGNVIATMVPPAETGAEHVPVYVAIDPLTEEVYVTDRPTGEIYIYDRDGRYQRTYTPAKPITGWQPMGIAFDPAGNLYVTDLSGTAPSVHVFDRTGAVVRTLGGAEGMSFPNGVAVDTAGNVYVTDGNNGRLLIFGSSGEVIGRIGRGSGAGNLGLPRGVAIDGNGRVFVVDSSGNGVLVFRKLAEGQERPDYVGFIGGHGVEDGQFSFPMGSAVDDRGRVYVADTANGRVQVWSY